MHSTLIKIILYFADAPEVLEAAAGREKVGLSGLVLPHENPPVLRANGGQRDGESHVRRVGHGQVDVLAAQHAAQVGGQHLAGDGVNAADGEGAVGAVAGRRVVRHVGQEVQADLAHLIQRNCFMGVAHKYIE
jgi:hypothetical protein